MKFLFDFVKGLIIGIANIIPGVSGGTMAVSMGVYDRLIGSLGNITKAFKKSVLTLLPIVLGMVAGIGLFSFIIPYCLTNYSFQTSMCFCGLILGGVPAIYTSTKKAVLKDSKVIRLPHIIAFVVFLAIAIFMAIASPAQSGSDSINVNFLMVIKLFFIGIIASATMVIPGVSGSLVLMLMGYYAGIIGSISVFLSALKDLDFALLMHCVGILLPFGIGCILGIFLISKIITWLFKNYESITYFGILGLIIASPFAILLKMENASFSPVSIIVGVILLIAGTAFTYIFSKKTA